MKLGQMQEKVIQNKMLDQIKQQNIEMNGRH